MVGWQAGTGDEFPFHTTVYIIFAHGSGQAVGQRYKFLFFLSRRLMLGNGVLFGISCFILFLFPLFDLNFIFLSRLIWLL